MYILTNGRNYLKTNTKLVSNIKQAKKYPTLLATEKAKVGMKRTFKKMGNWQVIEIDNQQSDEDVTFNSDGKVVSIISLDDKDLSSLDLVENISENYKKMLSYKAILENKITEKEKETQDLLHFIEFYDLDACNGFLIYKTLQQTRLERRRYKNELFRINNFLKADLQSVNNWTVTTKEKKTYAPRILIDLFKRRWKKHEERQKENGKKSDT